jgi:peptide-methionine (S)-S-oxide reductase
MRRIIETQSTRLVMLTFALAIIIGVSYNDTQGAAPKGNSEKENETMNDTKNTELATFGAGCFWCVEAVFERLDGVESVESGYCNGTVKNPTYEQVCSGTTGHAEVTQIRFNPDKISFETLLEVLFATHDPTTKNRQGNDFGTQYRSGVYFHDDKQKKQAEQFIKKLDASGEFKKPIVTEVTKIDKFYEAEDYHQDYFRLNPNQGYCRAMIPPKLKKLEKKFKDKLKND